MFFTSTPWSLTRCIISEDNASLSEDRRRLPVTANQEAGSSDKNHKGDTENPGNPIRHTGAFPTHTRVPSQRCSHHRCHQHYQETTMGTEDAAPVSSPEKGHQPGETRQMTPAPNTHRAVCTSSSVHPARTCNPSQQPSTLAHQNAPHAFQPGSHFRLATREKRKKRTTSRK